MFLARQNEEEEEEEEEEEVQSQLYRTRLQFN